MNFTIRKMVWILAPMVVALAFAMDVYVPAVPRLATLFDVSASEMQLTLNVFMFTSGIAQLIIGPMSDQYGRRRINFLSILVFAIGSGCCALSQNVIQLIIFRVIQAIGAIGMMVTAFAVVRDHFEGEASAKVYSYLNGIIAFSPMLAPFLGSYLDVDWGWRSIFLSLFVVALWAFVSVGFFLPESLPKEKRIPMTMRLAEEYKQIFCNKVFICYTLSTAIGLSYLYVFFSIAPYIIIRLLHIPEIRFGYYFAFMGVSFFLGSFLSGYLVGKLGVYKTVLFGFFISLVGAVIMTVWYFIGGLSIHDFIWPMLLIGVGGTLGMGAGSGGLMEPFPEKAGAASALSGSIRFLFSTFVSALVITKNVSSVLPLCLPAIIFSALGIILFLMYRKDLSFSP